MNKKEKQQFDKTLAYWETTQEEHRRYREAHPDKPLTARELKDLEDYQRMTHDPRWWR